MTHPLVSWHIEKSFFVSIQGCVLLFDDPIIHVTPEDAENFRCQLHVTSKYLSDTIKRVTGTSVSTYINRTATAIIKSYLDDNGLSITQIADEMQFTSVSYFSRYCVKHLGMSPARYRMAGAKGWFGNLIILFSIQHISQLGLNANISCFL